MDTFIQDFRAEYIVHLHKLQHKNKILTNEKYVLYLLIYKRIIHAITKI